MDAPKSFDEQDILDSYTYKVFDDVDLPLMSRLFEEKIDKRIVSALMRHEKYRVLFSFVERGGAFAGMEFVDWFTEKLNANCRNLGKATLQEFYEATGNDLTVVATDTTGHQKLVMNRLTAPNCPVVWAVRMSMSIPFLWQEVRWQNEWGKYRDEDISGHIVVDGGVLSNFPLNLVEGKDKEIRDVMGLSDAPSGGFLGFLIDEKVDVPGTDGTEPSKKNGILDEAQELKTVKRIMNLVDTMTEANDNSVIRAYPDHVCYLPAKGYGTTEFDMSEQRVELLIEAGRKTTSKYLDSLHK
jgi:predicted acylesterase/phospholipase RssA